MALVGDRGRAEPDPVAFDYISPYCVRGNVSCDVPLTCPAVGDRGLNPAETVHGRFRQQGIYYFRNRRHEGFVSGAYQPPVASGYV